jgi:maleate cis-trans isomerase
VYCTNVGYAEEAERVERELGALILDSVSVSYWAAVQLTGRPVQVAGYGRLFR